MRNSNFQWRIFIFLAAEKPLFGGGGITSKLASQWPSWGIYKHAPPIFWRKRRLLYWEKGGQIKTFSCWGGQLVAFWSLFFNIIDVSCAKKRLGLPFYAPEWFSFTQFWSYSPRKLAFPRPARNGKFLYSRVSGSKLKEELGQSYSLFVTVISTLELHAILTY